MQIDDRFFAAIEFAAKLQSGIPDALDSEKVAAIMAWAANDDNDDSDAKPS